MSNMFLWLTPMWWVTFMRGENGPWSGQTWSGAELPWPGTVTSPMKQQHQPFAHQANRTTERSCQRGQRHGWALTATCICSCDFQSVWSKQASRSPVPGAVQWHSLPKRDYNEKHSLIHPLSYLLWQCFHHCENKHNRRQEDVSPPS